MTIVMLNMLAIIGYSLHIARRRRGWVGLLTLVGAMAAFSLGRTRLSVSISMDQMRLTVVDLFPFAILPLWLMSGHKIKKNVIPVLGLIFLATFASLLAFLLKGQNVASAVYSWTSFAGPMLLGVYAGNLDEDGAYALGDNVEKIILALSVIGIISTQIAPATVGEFLGWQQGEASRLITPVGGSIASGATMILIWPRVLSKFLTGRDLLSFCRVLLLVGALLMTGSRAVMLALAVVTLVTVLIDVNSQVDARKMQIGSLKIVIVIISFGLGAYLLAQNPYVTRLAIPIGSMSGDYYRRESARTAAMLIAERPLMGHVPGHTYTWFHTDYSEVTQRYVWLGKGASLPEPHNTYLMIAVDYGVIVLGYFTAIMGHMIAAQAKQGLIGQGNPGVHYSLGIFAFLIQALGSSHLLVKPEVAVFFWLLYGSSVASIRDNKDTIGRPGSNMQD